MSSEVSSHNTQQVRALNVALANGQGFLAVLFPLWVPTPATPKLP